MRRDGDNRDHILAEAEVTEDAIGGGRVVLGVGFEDLLVVRALEGAIFVGVQGLGARVGLQVTEGFPDGLEALCQPLGLFQGRQVGVGLSRELELAHSIRLMGVLREAAALHQLALAGVLQALLHGFHGYRVLPQPRFDRRHFDLGFEDDPALLVAVRPEAARAGGEGAQGDSTFAIRSNRFSCRSDGHFRPF